MDSRKGIWSRRGVLLLTFLLMIVFFVLGTYFSKEEISNLTISDRRDVDIDFFIRILKNNMLAGLGILLGSISYCVISFSIISYSAFTIGVAFMSFAKSHSIYKSFALLMLHGSIEIIWLSLLILCAYDISNKLYEFLKDDQLKPMHVVNKETFTKIVISIFLITAGAYTEAYISIPFYQYLTNL